MCKLRFVAAASLLSLASGVNASPAPDFGIRVQRLVNYYSMELFGTQRTLGASSTKDLSAAEIDAKPAALVTVAKGLKKRVISADPGLGANIDMMALWPNDANPTHLIACNEQGSSNVGVQRIDIKTGAVETIIAAGLSSCDPVHSTAWGTIVVGEEAGSAGRIFEILDPLNTTGVTVSGSGASTTTSDPEHVAFRPAMGQLSFEGVGIYPNGVVYYGDERRPGNGNGGGAYFKFVPTTLWAGGPAIADLSNSPLVSGRIFGLRVGTRSNNTDFGQGTNAGKGVWVEVTGAAPLNLAAAASANLLTTFYRPEDLAIDLKALAAGNVRFCGNNTGEDGQTLFYGETFCMTDGTLEEAATFTTKQVGSGASAVTINTTVSTPNYQTLVAGFPELAMMDNIAYQPGRGNWLINEDGEGPDFGRNNDIWSCTDDGVDQDLHADACAKVITLNDLNAESTGGVFDATGKRYFVSIQHNSSGHGVILEITGWR